MQLYEISNGLGTAAFRRKQGDAHAIAKNMSPRGDVRVRLYDYPLAADDVEGLFNGVVPDNRTFKRAWMLTARGGMQEIEQAKAQAEVDEERQDKRASTDPNDGPFYWSHPESESFGMVATRAELEERLASDPCCNEISAERHHELEAQQALNDL